MKKVALVALFVIALVGVSFAQGLTEKQVAGERSIAIDAYGNSIPTPRYGFAIWDNQSTRAWWPGVTTGYINLDWGKMPDYNGLADELVDGFDFEYGTNNMDPAGETWSIYYFDSCTGWGNMGVQEAGFIFTGLPNGYGLPTLPPGYGWVWSITVDLEGGGYEYLLGTDFGIGMVRGATPLMGSTGTANGYAPIHPSQTMFTGTENAFDIYFPNGTYNGSWYFGAYPTWATWCHTLFGGQDPAANMDYYGQGSQGNQAMFLSSGTWSAGTAVNFYLRKNGSTLPGWLLASGQGQSQYIPSLDLTRLVGGFAGGTPMMMNPSFAGDYDVLSVTIPNVAGTMRIYTQGAITQLNPIPPADASNGIYSN
jgi:hypothetical protein